MSKRSSNRAVRELVRSASQNLHLMGKIRKREEMTMPRREALRPPRKLAGELAVHDNQTPIWNCASACYDLRTLQGGYHSFYALPVLFSFFFFSLRTRISAPCSVVGYMERTSYREAHDDSFAVSYLPASSVRLQCSRSDSCLGVLGVFRGMMTWYRLWYSVGHRVLTVFGVPRVDEWMRCLGWL